MPLMMRLRMGKFCGIGRRAHGEFRDDAGPLAAISAASFRFSEGYTRSTPQPSTATVLPPAAERALVGRRVDAARHPAHDGQAGAGQVRRQPLGDRQSVGRRPARSDDSQHQGIQQLDTAARKQHDRRIEDLAQQRRVARIAIASPATAPDSQHLLLLRRGVLERAAAGDALRHAAPLMPLASSSVRDARNTACGVRNRSSSFPAVRAPRPGTSLRASQSSSSSRVSGEAIIWST